MDPPVFNGGRTDTTFRFRRVAHLIPKCAAANTGRQKFLNSEQELSLAGNALAVFATAGYRLAGLFVGGAPAFGLSLVPELFALG